MTTMGVYVRDLLLGQYYFDTLFPRVPVPVLRQITSNLEKMNLPTKPSGSIGDNSRFGSEDTARRPPSVKAALSVSFGQRAPHRASTRDSSPVRRALPPSSYDDGGRDDSRRSPSRHRSQSRDLSDRDYMDRDRYRDRDRGRDWNGYSDRDIRDCDGDRARDRYRDYDRDRDRDRRRDYDRPRYSEREGSRRDRGNGRHSDYRSRRSRSRMSRSRSRSRQTPSERFDVHSSSQRDAGKEKEKASVSSNLAKLKDLYGDLSEQKGDASTGRGFKDSGSEEVIRLGGSTWR
ncbi:pre-mRNA splicing factor SR-like 1 isoform X2 [Silene latifolia]